MGRLFGVLENGQKPGFIAQIHARLARRDALCRKLSLDPFEVDDEILITQAYTAWGEGCVDQLEGEFAFAIWDDARKVLFCARDRFGVCPFVYAHTPERFAFASEIKTLLSLPFVARDLDFQRVGQYLADVSGAYPDQSSTFYRMIRRLPPAHTLTITQTSALTLRRYWSLDRERETHFASDDEYAEAFLHHFGAAVYDCIAGRSLISAQLSGGLDSSSVVAAARVLMPADDVLHTFYSHSALAERDEHTYVDHLLNALIPARVKHHIVNEPPPFADFERILAIHAEPPSSANPVVFDSLYGAAHDAQLPIMLDGDDGDTTVSHGIGLLPEMAHRGEWGRFLAESVALAVRGKSPVSSLRGYFDRYASPALMRADLLSLWRVSGEIAPAMKRAHAAQFAALAAKRARAAAPDGIKRMARRVCGKPDPALFDNLTLNADFVREIGLDAWMRANRADDARLIDVRHERDLHIKTLLFGGHQVVLEENDRLATYHGVQGRHPFRDIPLVEFCVSLPPEVKLRLSWTRWILRRSMRGILPPEIQWRRDKTNFSPSINHGMLTAHRDLLDSVVLGGVGDVIAPYVDRAALRETYAKLLASQPYTTLHYSERMEYAARSVRRAVILALWLS